MRIDRIIRISALFAAGLLATACVGESTSTTAEPEIQSKELAQLSAGGGIASMARYDFGWRTTIDGEEVFQRFASVLVTSDVDEAHELGLSDQTEYWRWEPSALAAIDAGTAAYDDFEVDATVSDGTFDPATDMHIISDFEADTDTWASWTVNRLFDRDGGAQLVQNAGDSVLYTLEAENWTGSGPTITYFLQLDFSGFDPSSASSYPELHWFVDAVDFTIWQQTGDDDSIYEVRMTDETELSQTPWGAMFELKPVK